MQLSCQPTHHFLIIEDRKYRRTLSLQDKFYSLGRSPKNSIVISSDQASRHHATLIRKKNRLNNEETYWILDGDRNGKKSRNGIYVNGEKCSVKELKQGDLINFGCDVNATFYSLNNWSDSIIPINNYQPENVAQNPSNSISVSESNIEFPHSQILNSTTTLHPKSTLNPKRTIKGQRYQDPLTKLANQQLFKEYLSIALKNATLKQSPLALLFLNVNQFRTINENWGYPTGDLILQAIGKRIKASVRDSDIVARWADDQFVILFPRIRKSHEI
ncbi:diguanylate cyclase domain-containing protein, partial [Crocosphaera chwakensis]